jgi:hypothetical protein
MANNNSKSSRKSIRKQRWAAVIAGILALGMLVSSVFIYFNSVAGRNTTPGQDWSLEDYLEYYQSNVDQMEAYIEEHGPTTAVLESLLEGYNYLMMFQQLSGELEGNLVLQNKMVGVYESLIELAPSVLRYRIELLHAYKSIDAEEEKILEQAVLLADLLRESPQSAVHLQLINFLASMEAEQLLDQEIAWFSAYLQQRIEDEEADNVDRYCLAILAAEHLDDLETAYAQIALIMDAEEEGSALYNEAKAYLDKITAQEETPDGESE